MAENLRFIETLDHSNFDKGIAESTQAVRKLAEDAELANKGIKGMFDTPAMKEAAATFSGVQRAVEGFTRAMSRQLPMKQELRETQKAAMQLEQIWRNLSDAEKQSAAGQELRSKIDMLIQRGGVLKDTMIDVGNAIKFQASDTAKLDAVVGGVQALTAAAQVAAGAMGLLGMSQEDAAKVQKDLIAIMSVVNGLQVIQNALQKESALMMGLNAARTAALNTVTAVKVAMAKADTTATKAAAAAQVLWNTAVKANPIGAAIAVVAAATAAIYAYTRGVNDAAESHKHLNEAIKEQASQVAEAKVKLMTLREEWRQLTSDSEREQWVRNNADAFKSLGIEVKTTADAENVLVRNTQNVVAAMTLRAEAAARAAAAQKAMQQAMELREEAVHRRANPTAWDEFVGGLKGPFGGSAQTEAGRAADAMETQADQLDKLAKEQIRASAQLNIDAAALSKNTVARTAATKATRAHSAAVSKSKQELIEGSYAWYDAEISRLKQLADQQTDYFSRKAMLEKAAAVEAAKNLQFGDLRTGAAKIDTVTLVDQVNASIGKLNGKIGPLVIPVTFKDPIEAAKEESQQLLDKTAGLRTAAQAAAGAFRELGNAIGGQAGKMVNVAGMLAQAIATMIQGYATALAQAATMGPWAWAAFGLTGLGQLMAMIAGVRSAAGFAQGGIVGGTSYSGDKQYIRVNSGEMILNGQQQARLFSMINSGGSGGEVTFRIAGQQLVGVLNNYNGKMSKVR